jgi:hypothetical protein
MNDFQPNCTVIDADDVTRRVRGQLGMYHSKPLAFVGVTFRSEDVDVTHNKPFTTSPIPLHYVIPDETVKEIEVLYSDGQGTPHTDHLPVDRFSWFDESALWYQLKLRENKAARNE